MLKVLLNGVDKNFIRSWCQIVAGGLGLTHGKKFPCSADIIFFSFHLRRMRVRGEWVVLNALRSC